MAGGIAKRLGTLLVVACLAAGCGVGYAPSGLDPARLEIAAQGSITQADIQRAVFEQVGSLQDQPTLFHWLGKPTWQVEAYMLGNADAIWALKPLDGLAKPQIGMKAGGVAVFEAPSGKNHFRITWACVVTHYWDEGGTWQEPVYVYLRQQEVTLDLAPGQVLRISPFTNEKGK